MDRKKFDELVKKIISKHEIPNDPYLTDFKNFLNSQSNLSEQDKIENERVINMYKLLNIKQNVFKTE